MKPAVRKPRPILAADGISDLSSDNIHGQLGESPNKLYKNYCNWFKKTYSKDKKPLNFKAWLEWAKKKGVVKSDNMSADGVMQTLEVKIREIQMGYVLIGAGLGAGLAHVMKNKGNIGWFIAGGAVAGAIISLAIPKIKVSAGEEEKKGGGGSSGGGGGGSSTKPLVNQTTIPPVIVVSAPRKIVRAAPIPTAKPVATTSTAMPTATIQTPTSPSTPPIGTTNPVSSPTIAPALAMPTT